ncbi:hypothetical protein CR983_02395 [Candidatus Saccharibacteria bacterium]|nr:MAG: hypothetical protein CR983_02395 [Candidatus Saccharibacteria bacterium]
MSIASRRFSRALHDTGTPVTPGHLTGGSGGEFVDVEFQDYTYDGRTGQYHIYAADRESTEEKPLGLVLQFHGDGAYEFDHPDAGYSLGGDDGVRQVALDYNMLCVPLRTPNDDDTWWTTGNSNADWVADFVQTVLYPRYNIDLTRIWLSGYSGGAQFISQFFVPEYSNLMVDGGAVISGGGGAPNTNSDPSTVNPFADRFKQSYNLHWFTATGDTGWDDEGYNAYADAQAGEAWYEERGFETLSHHYPEGGGHSTVTHRFGQELRDRMVAKYGT